MPVIPALRRLRQKDQEFRVILGYINELITSYLYIKTLLKSQ